jgi:hypothetical protein
MVTTFRHALGRKGTVDQLSTQKQTDRYSQDRVKVNKGKVDVSIARAKARYKQRIDKAGTNQWQGRQGKIKGRVWA